MSSTRNLQRGTADAEIKAPSVENPGLTNVLPRKPGVGQNIATHASTTARNFFLVQIFTYPTHSPSFISKSSPSCCTIIVIADSRVGLQNKTGHPAHNYKRFKQVPVALI